MYKKRLHLLIFFSFLLVFVKESVSQRYVEGGPVQNFTIQELDRLKQLQPVIRDHLLYTLDEENALILSSNYPSSFQIFTGGSFPKRVQLTEFNPGASNARYTINSPYSQPASFLVNVNRVFDAYLSPLEDPEREEMTDSTNLINIRYINDEFIRQTEGRSFNRITHNLGSLVLFLNAIQGVDIANLNKDEKKKLSYSLLTKYIHKNLNKFLIIDAETVLNVEDAVQLNRSLQNEIFNYLGVDREKLPEIYTVQNFLVDNGWLETIKSVPLLERIERGDPSIIKLNVLSNLRKIRSTGSDTDSDTDIGEVASDEDSRSSSSSGYESSDSDYVVLDDR